MPRKKGFRRSEAAKRRMAVVSHVEPLVKRPAYEVQPPLKKSAPIPTIYCPKTVNEKVHVTAKTVNEKVHVTAKTVNEKVHATANKTVIETVIEKVHGTANKTVIEKVHGTANKTVNEKVHVIDKVSANEADKVLDGSVIRGSFSQDDMRFGSTRNKQCAAISLTSVLQHCVKNVLTWQTADLDNVLNKGNDLYVVLKNTRQIGKGQCEYILIPELPRTCTYCDKYFEIKFGSSFGGFTDVFEYDAEVGDFAMPFHVAVERSLRDFDACLVTIAANTCAIIKQGHLYAIVDSHATSFINGQQYRSATSFVAYYSNIDHVIGYFYDFANRYGNAYIPFEVTGIKPSLCDTNAGAFTVTNSQSRTNVNGFRSAANPDKLMYHDSRPAEGICIKDCNKEPNAQKPLGDSQLNNQTVIAAVSLDTERKPLKVIDVKATATGKPTAANTTCKSSQCSATSTTPKSKLKLIKCSDGNSKQELYVSKLDKEKLRDKKNTQENVDLTNTQENVDLTNTQENVDLTNTQENVDLTDVLFNENVLTDDIIIGNTINNEFSFKLLTSANQEALCARLHLTNENHTVQEVGRGGAMDLLSVFRLILQT
nr:uncharacterized protein LOC129450017 [Misgurnus anguillicaudatus]